MVKNDRDINELVLKLEETCHKEASEGKTGQTSRKNSNNDSLESQASAGRISSEGRQKSV
jgi:hypothetical protein